MFLVVLGFWILELVETIASWGPSYRPAINMLPIGFMLGLACWVSAIGGLALRSWLGGLSIATLIVVLVASSLLLSERPAADWDHLDDTLVVMLVLPLVVASISTPLLLTRWLRGWRLTTEDHNCYRRPFSIEDILTVTSTLAGLLFLCRIPQIVWETPAQMFFLTMLAISSVLVVASTFVTLPLTWLVMRPKANLIGWLLFLLLALFLTFATFLLFDRIMIALGNGTGASWRSATT